eukprot:354391-Rhodomonas_salina.1
MSGTDVGIVLCTRYEMSGTDVGHPAVSGTKARASSYILRQVRLVLFLKWPDLLLFLASNQSHLLHRHRIQQRAFPQLFPSLGQ